MKKVKITTPENIDVEYLLSNAGSRAAAAIIDTIIQAVLILLAVAVLLIIHDDAPSFWSMYMGWIVGVFLLIIALIGYGYYVILELNMNGMTFGKKLMKIRVIRDNGQAITLKHSAIRNLFKLFIDGYGIGLICVLFSKEHKRLGDFVASTIVITEQYKPKSMWAENLENINKQLYYYLTPEEQAILTEYLSRKNTITTNYGLSEEIKLYFSNKFEALGISKEWENLIIGL